ncbi:MAG: FUSC family protein [Symbiopectobacterium sp.]
MENVYVWGLAGYTALIIIVSPQGASLLTPQFAVERCRKIVLGIVCTIVADLLFTPRSIKYHIDSSLEWLLLDHYRLLQLCIRGASREGLDIAWHGWCVKAPHWLA